MFPDCFSLTAPWLLNHLTMLTCVCLLITTCALLHVSPLQTQNRCQIIWSLMQTKSITSSSPDISILFFASWTSALCLPPACFFCDLGFNGLDSRLTPDLSLPASFCSCLPEDAMITGPSFQPRFPLSPKNLLLDHSPHTWKNHWHVVPPWADWDCANHHYQLLLILSLLQICTRFLRSRTTMQRSFHSLTRSSQGDAGRVWHKHQQVTETIQLW